MRTFLFLLLTIAGASAQETRVFRAGAATSVITPPIGMDIVGGFHPFPSTHIHDELHARCLVLDDGKTKVAFAVCDLLGLDRGVSDEARRFIAEESGIPKTHVLISATHTHSASSALGANRFSVGQPLDEYQRFVARRIADGVRRAVNQLAPAQMAWGTAQEPREVFNRRWFMKPGTVPVNPFGSTGERVKMNPPRGSENLVEPAGPVDPEICFLAVRTAEGQPLAVLANYALHYVGDVGKGHVSADYYGAFCERLEQLLNAEHRDPPFVAILSNGTSGNINNIDFTNKTPEKFPLYGRIRKVADRVANDVLTAYQNLQWRDWVSLDARYEEPSIATRQPTAEQVEHARAILADPHPAGEEKTLPEIYAERTLGMAEYPAKLPIPLQIIRVGEVAIGAVPCEVFVETGLAFKARSPFKPSFIMEIAHGYYGYLPTPEQHQFGGYETWLGTNRLEVDASTKILEALLRMAGEMK